MKFLNYLQEKYITSVEGQSFGVTFDGGPTEIFVNPSNKEMREAASKSSGPWKGMVRFIADLTNKNLYVFKADTLHKDVEKVLVKERLINNAFDVGKDSIWAVAKLISGKLEFESSDSMSYNSFDDYLRLISDDKWTEKYFKPSLLQSIKSKLLH
jgi:hypothetical protein